MPQSAQDNAIDDGDDDDYGDDDDDDDDYDDVMMTDYDEKEEWPNAFLDVR